MTIHSDWQHSWAYPDEHGVAPAAASVAGHHVLSGGGYAEAILSNGSNESSTESNGTSARAFYPIVAMFSYYDSVSDRTNFFVYFAANPYARVRAHININWET